MHDAAGRHLGDIGSSKKYAPASRAQIARDDINEGSLPRTVRADDREAFALMQREIDVIRDDNRPKRQLQIFGAYQFHQLVPVTGCKESFRSRRLLQRLIGSAPVMPVGATRMTIISVAPRSSFQVPGSSTVPTNWMAWKTTAPINAPSAWAKPPRIAR